MSKPSRQGGESSFKRAMAGIIRLGSPGADAYGKYKGNMLSLWHDVLATLYPIFYLVWLYIVLVNVIDFQTLSKAVRAVARTPLELPFGIRYSPASWLIYLIAFTAPLILFAVPMLIRAFMRLFLPTRTPAELYDGVMPLMLSPPRLVRRLAKGRYGDGAETSNVLRGARLTAYHMAKDVAKKLTRELKNQHAFFHWGTLPIPINRHLSHFALLGMSRSGKTTVMRLLMQDILPPTLARAPLYPQGRAVIFDPKSEFYPLLLGMGIPANQIAILNPFDLRCRPWNIAADIENETDASAIASLLVETPGEEQRGAERFYNTASRNVISGLLLGLHLEYGNSWTFRDFLLVLDRIEYVMEFLNKRPETARYIRDYDANPETFGNLRATLRNIIIDYHAIASCWHHSDATPISINEWMRSSSHDDKLKLPSILLLGYDPSKPVQFSVLNRALIYKIAQSILTAGKQIDPNKDRTWVFLDEATLLGKLPIMTELLNTGASRGCSVILGFQTVQGMSRVFGEKESAELIGQCANLAVFRLGNNPATAEWAASTIGKAEQREWTESYTSGTSQSSKSQSYSTQERFAVRPETLQNIPQINPVNGLHGFFISECYGVIDASSARVSGSELRDMLNEPKEGVDPIELRDHKQMTLSPWTKEEAARFGFSVDGQTKPAPEERATAANKDEPSKARPTASFLDGIGRFEDAAAEPSENGHAAPHGEPFRRKSVSEAYADACRDQAKAINERAISISRLYTTEVLKAREKHGAGSRKKRKLMVLSRSEAAAPTPQSNAKEHAARRVAAQMIAEWCEQHDMEVTVKTVPSGKNVPPSIVEEIILEVLL